MHGHVNVKKERHILNASVEKYIMCDTSDIAVDLPLNVNPSYNSCK